MQIKDAQLDSHHIIVLTWFAYLHYGNLKMKNSLYRSLQEMRMLDYHLRWQSSESTLFVAEQDYILTIKTGDSAYYMVNKFRTIRTKRYAS